MPPPDGRVLVAFDDSPTLTWEPEWTALDQEHPHLVTSYQIDRGRQYELDKTDTGRATVEIADTLGLLDPTNTASPYFTQIEPLKQVMLRRYNPVADEWETRFRGFVEELSYGLDPTQRVYRLTLQLVDLFEILSAIQMYPFDPAVPGSGGFGDDPTDGGPAFADDVAGQVWFGPVDTVTDPESPDPYAGETMEDRIEHILEQASIPDDFRICFSGNTVIQQASYSPGESPMTAIQEAADAEFPGVSNVYCDRHGRICIHGRLAKFDPAGVIAGLEDPTNWDFHSFQAGDGGYVTSAPGTYAHLRDFAFGRGLAKVINHALATPKGISDEDVPAQLVQDIASIARVGYRSWSAQGLLTRRGLIGPVDGLTETRRFAEYYVSNMASARNRVTGLAFRAIDPTSPGASETWRLLSQVDISDTVEVSVDAPAGGGFADEPYFVEGVHESSQPANPDYDDVSLSLDLSPRAYFETNPWGDT